MRTEDDLRAALGSLERNAPVASAVLAAVSAKSARKRRIRRIRLGGAGLAAAAAATAAVIVAAQGPAPVPAHTGQTGQAGPTGQGGQRGHRVTAPAHVTLTARDVLLAAATSAAAAPDTGTYWQTEIVSGGLWTAGPNASPFAVEQRYTPSYTWDALSDSQRSWTLPAPSYTEKPATPGAESAWRADGSPALPGSDGQREAWWQVGGNVGSFGNADLTLAQFQALPSDASGLAAAMNREIAREGIAAGPATSQRMFDICTQLLKLDPITSQVRAAVFRMLASLPGVRSIGQVTDPLGGTGYGIEEQEQNLNEVLVIAPGAGRLLADEEVASTVQAGQQPVASGAAPGPTTCPGEVMTQHDGRRLCQTTSGGYWLDQPVLAVPAGTVESYDVLVSQGWTDASPSLPPAAEQFSTATQGKG